MPGLPALPVSLERGEDLMEFNAIFGLTATRSCLHRLRSGGKLSIKGGKTYGDEERDIGAAQTCGAVPRCICRKVAGHKTGRVQVGKWSFPKLKIPHQSHADFCSTDTAGGLDNKKRRYAPRGGVAYRLFLWGFPKGATPPFGTRLCEAKCSVLYALPALP